MSALLCGHFAFFRALQKSLGREGFEGGVMKNEGVRGSEGLLQPDVGDAFFVVGIAERGVAEFFVKGSHARLTVDDRAGAACRRDITLGSEDEKCTYPLAATLRDDGDPAYDIRPVRHMEKSARTHGFSVI